MPLYQRRRPSPIRIIPRDEPTATGAPSPASPKSPSSSPKSQKADSPSPTTAAFPESTKLPSPKSTTPPKVSSAAPAPVATSQANSSPPPPAATTTAIPQQTSSAPGASKPTEASSAKPEASTATPKASSASLVPSSQASSVPAVQITQGPSPTKSAVPSNFSSQTAVPIQPSIIASAPSSSESEIAAGVNSPQKASQHSGPSLSKGGEAALITCAVLGAVALIIGLIIFIKRRRRKEEYGMRHAEDAFNPSNTGSLHTPETVHIGGSHLTRSTNTESLFGPGPYMRPETVSTNNNQSRVQPSRIQPPQPTPNPFADPPLNKAYDVLRGRPRSTTLTDRGSWIKNPFKDPGSERFDPFGELQQKARVERVRYMEDLRHEQEFLEKERMGLGPQTAGAQRKGSGVTVEGLGVLDRSEDARGYR